MTTHEVPKAETAALHTGRDEIRISSFLLGVRAEDLWFQIGTPRGINEELAPLLTMRMPAHATWARLADVPVGEPAGRCSVRLFGVLPVDYDELMLAEVTPGERFREESSTRTTRLWGHERTLTPTPEGTWITDRLLLDVRPGLRATRAIHRRIATALFEHRHRRLRSRIGPRLRIERGLGGSRSQSGSGSGVRS
ncbi:hypothetical protein K8W59_08560 [Nocardioides rotundus]|uniref:hypothetical protein n=1 Tax=Nocardioides rotundus TaxID=1774216 RepID=UPI001CBCCB53|nr:hypothetical protein [Nocardioides rotundus]UAL31475.1 hypothetical protein K8W59_08560 [Nocardioides rotundus]